jgi:hypothetical protein
MADERRYGFDRPSDTAVRPSAAASETDAEMSQGLAATQEQVSDMYKMGTIDDAQGLN